MVFGMGGGKVGEMDTAKGAAYGWGTGLTFPTIPSNCAFHAVLSVVYRKDGGLTVFTSSNVRLSTALYTTDIMIHAPDVFSSRYGGYHCKIFECHFSAAGMSQYHSALAGDIISAMRESELMRKKPGGIWRRKAGKRSHRQALAITVNTDL